MLNIHLFLKVVHQISISISKILYSLVQLVHQLLLSITQILKHIVKQHFNYTISKFHKQVFQQHCILITIIHYFLLVLQTNIPCNHLTYINIKFLCIQIIFTHRIKATSSCHQLQIQKPHIKKTHYLQVIHRSCKAHIIIPITPLNISNCSQNKMVVKSRTVI